MRTVGFLLYPGYSMMSLAVATAFELANSISGSDVYDIRMISEAGGPVRTSLHVHIDTQRLDDRALDTLVIGGGMEPLEETFVDFVRQAAAGSRRVAAICTGAFVLAATGLLDGRRATTHWAMARQLREDHPSIRVDEDRIFINDGRFWTSAGMTAGVDLALALIEDDHGPELARAVARKLVVYHRRAGGQSQFSALLDLEPKSDRIQTALAYARRNLGARLSVEDLAEIAHLSPRQFSRAFVAETGQSPAKAIEHLRLEAARVMMEDTRHPIDVVAQQTGFGDRDRMRRAFMRNLGQPPQAIRRAGARVPV
ncbi:transcriptional regulator GlxA family with amidase domain [Brevundimonas vesicularis]|uniref:Transcriptional regulator GlxA family with amidase domain n=1 Tax=Brevundimonas vesicularis TaxID=41276 RepID=A0A7W9L4E9_BREVE|nr:GlxA family transcriptional regulator [Brevundimonas vesicularis]MBB5770245.1 transcriptional regulator GlxA family with amidase domain [Brevundimonas vesicularis]